MRIKNEISAFFVLCILSINVYADNKKDIQIHTMLTTMDNAIENKDAETIAKYLDDNIHIIMKMTLAGESKILEFTKDKYIETLEQGWALTEEYTYTRDKVNIEYIGKGNKAVVTTTLYELSVVDGAPMAALSHEKTLVEFRDGEPLIMSITVNTDVRM